jgi:hypothetical protein
MEVDTIQLGGLLAPEERKRLFDENWCFYCRDKGHRSAHCWKKPANKQSRPTGNPFTRPTNTNPFRARAAALEELSDATSSTGTIISQPNSSKEEIIQQFRMLSREDREGFLNDMMSTEDF